jgi:DNA-binding transcriptional LysR family regulator
MIDAHQMNVFMVAAQELNFSAAARRLNMTQPSVSQHIQTLEQRFKCRLFERKGRHLSLTSAGETLLPLAQRMVNLSIHIEETMASLQGQVHGHLIIGCCTTAGRFLLPKLLARFRERYPNVSVTCYVTDQRTACAMLVEGRLHLTVASDRQVSKDMEYLRFVVDPVVLVVWPDHPWAERKSIEPQALLEAEFVAREENSGTMMAVANALPEVGLSIDQLSINMVLGSSSSVALAVQERIGVAFLTRLAVQQALERGDLVQVEVKGLEMWQEVWIGRNVHQPATQAQSAFWEFIVDPANEILKNLRRNGLLAARQAT